MHKSDSLILDFLEHLQALAQRHTGESLRKAVIELLDSLHESNSVYSLLASLAEIVSRPEQLKFFAEYGIRPAHGEGSEIKLRLLNRLAPLDPDGMSLDHLFERWFPNRRASEWVFSIPPMVWGDIFKAFRDSIARNAVADGADSTLDHSVAANVGFGKVFSILSQSARVLSHRLSGISLDRELLDLDPDLVQYESPFVAQNEFLIARMARDDSRRVTLSSSDIQEFEVLLEQCHAAIARIRRRMRIRGVTVRLTYLVIQMEEMCCRLGQLIGMSTSAGIEKELPDLLRSLVNAHFERHRILRFMGENLAMLARNVTENASRRGEHYIAETKEEWSGIFRSAAGAGFIIALMALVKIGISSLGLPPLTEGILSGLNYSFGFMLIHLAGFTVATKQPAMTAASIASVVHESTARESARLQECIRRVMSTQWIAVVGNVAIAMPFGMAIYWAYLGGTGVPLLDQSGAFELLTTIDPVGGGALFYAAIAGVGLFMAGLVSGYFDNKASLVGLRERLCNAPWLVWLNLQKRQRVSHYVDEHFGALMGNLFFGLFLGLVATFGKITGLPLDIRHIAFSSANWGMAFFAVDFGAQLGLLALSFGGVLLIGLVNLSVSFSLALYVAMKSRGLGAGQLLSALSGALKIFFRNPRRYLAPPPKAHHLDSA